MKTKNEELAEKYPVIYGRDHGQRRLIGDLVRNFADIIELHSDDLNRALDFLDAQFLFGAWGDVMREVLEYSFTKDLRGFIIAAYNEGVLRGRIGPEVGVQPPAEPEWCWREKYSEMACGTFKSREEVIEEARSCSDSRTVMIGRCVYPDPARTAGECIDLECLLEQMEEYAYENEYPYEDPVFNMMSDKADGQKKAHAAYKKSEEALKAAVRSWARQHFALCTTWHTSEQEEEVEINPEADDG